MGAFEWPPDGMTIAFTAPEKRPEARRKHFGDFEVVRRDCAFPHHWTIDVESAVKAPAARPATFRGTSGSS